ncbi:MAG: acyl-CoA desaturase [Gemmatimonadota bacterium]
MKGHSVLSQSIRVADGDHDDIVYPAAIPFALVHLACLGILWSGVTWPALFLGAGLWAARMILITAGYHRYFSHRTYRTSRAFQFVLAFLCQTSLQKGILWWAAKHRHHHKHSDTGADTHSPREHGFWFAHVGWIFARRRGVADYGLVHDLAAYPELVWLDRYRHLPGAALAVVCLLIAGWPGLFVGFFLSTSVLFHSAFSINSLAHQFGNRRYATGDDSRNNWWLALLTMGEGWHNNHHYYQNSTRQGFRWYEIDVTFYVLKALSWTGIVWDLKAPPEEVIRGERRLSRVAIEKVARELVATFSIESIIESVQQARGERPTLPSLDELPAELPDLEELRRRAQQMFVHTPSFEQIAERARELLADSVSARLFREPPALGTSPEATRLASVP